MDGIGASSDPNPIKPCEMGFALKQRWHCKECVCVCPYICVEFYNYNVYMYYVDVHSRYSSYHVGVHATVHVVICSCIWRACVCALCLCKYVCAMV